MPTFRTLIAAPLLLLPFALSQDVGAPSDTPCTSPVWESAAREAAAPETVAREAVAPETVARKTVAQKTVAQTTVAREFTANQDGKTYEELLEDVADDDGRKRRVAVRRLSELGTPKAWERVLERLTDSDAQVADEAQLRLADLADDELWEDLGFGKLGTRHKDPLVRRRVLEALGRANAPLDLKTVIGLFKERDPEARRLLAFSLERLAVGDSAGIERFDDEGRTELVKALLRLASKEKDGGVRAAALLAAQRMEMLVTPGAPAAREAAESLFRKARDTSARVGALTALGRSADDAALALCVGALEDDALPVRLQVVDSLFAARNRTAALGLVTVLESEPVSAVARRAVNALQRFSGLKFRSDPRPWRDWADALPEGWTPEDRNLEGRGDGAGDESTVTKLVGLPIRSERLAMLIDMSGSMWQSRPDGRKTKDLVDVEVRRCLEGLPTSARFNLVPYATEPGPYTDELVAASSKKVAKALEWFEENEQRGKGNVWDAIEVALADPDVDTLVVMTDGAPTGGPHWNLELMVPLLLERNRFRHVTFDVLLTETSGGLVRHWQALADATGGTCLEVTFDE